MTNLLESDLDRFVAHLRQRLDAGAREYGNSTFDRPLVELVDELKEEAADIAGWGFLLWLRLDRLRAKVESITKGGTDAT